MTNAEKYKNAIIAQMCKTGDWAVNQSREITPCNYTKCADCQFRISQRSCIDGRKEWLNAVADEKKEFSEKDKEVLRALYKVKWVVRDEDGAILGYHNKPYKMWGTWYCTGSYIINLTVHTIGEFTPVKCEDDEPTSREEILGGEK